MNTPQEDYALNLDLMSADDVSASLPPAVLGTVTGTDIVVFRVPDDASDTAACSARYGIDLEDCANTIVVRYKKDGGEQYAAIVTLGSKRLDVNGAAKRHLGAQRISFASREIATELSGMEYGGITAFGVPDSWSVIVEASVMERERIVMGAGIREAKLLLSPQRLLALPNVSVAALAT
ncbi:YbaK/EbsC family protein [Caballeronia insecticola]|uniref:YbaK/prolyl-tRNA synthetase associated region n=1 Tax=Caballeronia insecticola TaxID=758793 RepID=R4X2Q5_9BURK|nr:YbaK/EbsC family protein [Caballeronia insecticola]BAN26871.1 YbaK/prolyl-tRNA synthetase associated region [Caballeronia insecticola]